MATQPDKPDAWRTQHERPYLVALVVIVHLAVLLWVAGRLGLVWDGVVGLVIALPMLILAAMIWRSRHVPFRIGGRHVPPDRARLFAGGVAAVALLAAALDTQGWRVGRWVAHSLAGTS